MGPLTVAEVADVAEVPPGTVRDHLRKGRLHGRKRGRDWLIEEEDAAKWIKAYRPYDTLRKRAEDAR